MRHRATIVIAALAVSVFGLTACNKGSQAPSSGPSPAPNATQPAGANKPRRIVFIFKSVSQYSEACKKGAVQANDELRPQGVSVEFLAPDTADVAKQISQMDQLIGQKVDAIVISPNDAKAIVPIIKRAMDSGVKVFTWDSDAPGSQRIFYVAAADDVGIGRDIADNLARDMGGNGKVQIVSGGRAADNLNLHIKGMEEGFKKYPGITLIEPYIYNDDNDQKARATAQAAFQKDPDIRGFACANSPSPPAVAEVITSAGKIGKVKVWGLSLPSLTRQYLKSGAISGIMLWDPGQLTYVTAMLVNDYLNSKQPEDGEDVHGTKIQYKEGKVLIPGVTFTKDNVDKYNF